MVSTKQRIVYQTTNRIITCLEEGINKGMYKHYAASETGVVCLGMTRKPSDYPEGKLYDVDVQHLTMLAKQILKTHEKEEA